MRAGLLALGLSAAAGCSTVPAARHAPTREPLAGGVLRLAQETPVSLDPTVGDSVYESLPVNQIFDGLVSLGASLTVTPALAESWTVCRKGLVYDFRLRDGVRFHDGSRLSAADVVFSLTRLLDPGREHRSPAFSYLTLIEGAREYAAGTADAVRGIEAIDDRVVRITLAQPYASFLEVLAMEGALVVPRAIVERLGDEAFGRAPVGTGPFRFESWNADRLTLAANPGYFGRRPLLDRVELVFLNERSGDDGAAGLLDGSLDVVEPSWDDLARVEGRPDIQVFHYQELSLDFLGLSLRHPPADDPLVRQAIAHAIDRAALVAAAPELRRPATGILPPGISGYFPEPKALAHDPERARSLLAEAGHPGGRGLAPLVVHQAHQSTATVEVLRRIAADLAAVGIRVEVRPVSWAQLDRDLDEDAAPAFLLAWVADLTDPESFLRSLFESGGPGNYFAYADAQTDRLLAEGTAELGPPARAAIYRRLERHILEQAPIVPLFHTRGVVARRTGVHGVEPGPLGLAKAELERAWIERERRAR